MLRDNQKIADLLASYKGLLALVSWCIPTLTLGGQRLPVIYRNTAQWFVSMESHGLRDTALSELAKIIFYPAAGQKALNIDD